MEPSLNAQRTHEMSDPAMRPILDWIESYAVWTSLSPYTRASILKRAQKGEEAAREAMVNHNMRLVLSRATKKVGLGVPLPDLIQEGWLGLREAVQKYESKRGTKFSTMAVNWIDQKLGRALVTQGRTVYLPHKASEVLLRVARTVHRGDELQAEDQQWMDNLAREIYSNRSLTNVTLDYFDHLLVGAASMDKPIAHVSHAGVEQDKTLADILPAPGNPDPSDTLDLEALLLDLVNRGTLSRREGWLIVRHFGLDGEGGRTLVELAQELCDAEVRAGLASADKRPLSRERIRQLIAGAMTKIRQSVGQTHGEVVYQQRAGGVYLAEQRKGSQVPLSPGKVKSTESPKRSTRNTSVNDLSQETVASRAATPTPLLRVHDNTKRAKGSSRGTRKSSGLDVPPYAEAI